MIYNTLFVEIQQVAHAVRAFNEQVGDQQRRAAETVTSFVFNLSNDVQHVICRENRKDTTGFI